MSLLRGRVYDMQQNRIKAAICYQDALRRDVKCYEGVCVLPRCVCVTKVRQRARFCAKTKKKRLMPCSRAARRNVCRVPDD